MVTKTSQQVSNGTISSFLISWLKTVNHEIRKEEIEENKALGPMAG
jgi:hypothetical protein